MGTLHASSHSPYLMARSTGRSVAPPRTSWPPRRRSPGGIDNSTRIQSAALLRKVLVKRHDRARVPVVSEAPTIDPLRPSLQGLTLVEAYERSQPGRSTRPGAEGSGKAVRRRRQGFGEYAADFAGTLWTTAGLRTRLSG